MLNTTTPPHHNETTTKLFRYNPEQLKKTLDMLSEKGGHDSRELIDKVKISVWAIDPAKKEGCVDILESKLSKKAFDILASKAHYITYTGPFNVLQEIGVA